MFKASLLSAFLTALIVSTAALAQNVQLPPPPGTIEDPTVPVKLVADGPPRPLIRMDAAGKPKTLASIQDASTGALSAR